MNKHRNINIKSEQSTNPAIQEMADLLSNMHFSAHYGPYARGKYVSVMVDPRWNEDNETIQVTIQCVARGQRVIPWKNIPIFIRTSDKDITSVDYGTVLNDKGLARLAKIMPEEYRILASPISGQLGQPVPRPTLRPLGLHAMTIDRQVEVKVSQSEDGLYGLRARSRKRDLTGKSVLCAFLDRATLQVQLSKQIKLKPVAEESKGEFILEGEWKEHTHGLAGVECMAAADGVGCDFVFCVLSQQDLKSEAEV